MHLLMGAVRYGSIIGVFSENYQARLDIGTRAMKKSTPASHESWATKLHINRVDGPSVGEVEDTHLVGIFSEDNKYRLDVGTRSMKEDVPATHVSHATKLKILSLMNKNEGTTVKYGDLVGIFSEDGQTRLDIGSAAVKEIVPASHKSWATELRVQQADPIVEVTDIIDMRYLLDKSKIKSTKQQGLYSVKIPNDSQTVQTIDLGETDKVTETAEWTNEVGFKAGVETTVETSIPFVAKGQVKVSAETSYNHGWGGSTTKEKAWTWNVNAKVQPGRVMDVLVLVSKSDIEVPYEMTADLKHLSGEYTRGTIGGVFRGSSSHDLHVEYKSTNLDGTDEKVEGVESFEVAEALT